MSESIDPKANEHGVFTDYETVPVYLSELNGARLEIFVAIDSEGKYRSSFSYSAQYEGHSGLPNIHDNQFGTKEDAIIYEINKVIHWKRDDHKLSEALENWKSKFNQMSLF